MPRREANLEVDACPQELWRFLRDFDALCSCIPGVERVEPIDARHAVVTVKEKIGVVPMVLALHATIESEDPPRSLHAVARAEHLTMAIDVALQGSGDKTVLHTVFDVTGTGPLKAIVDNLFERRATERTASFAACLGRRFAAATPRVAAPPIVAPSVASRPPEPVVQGWIARIAERLRRLFARSPT